MARKNSGYQPKWNATRKVWEYHFSPPNAERIRKALPDLPRDPHLAMGRVWAAATAMHESLGYSDTGNTSRETARDLRLVPQGGSTPDTKPAPSPAKGRQPKASLPAVPLAPAHDTLPTGIAPGMVEMLPWSAVKTKGRRSGQQVVLGAQVVTVKERTDTSHLSDNPTFDELVLYYRAEHTRQNLPIKKTLMRNYHSIQYLIGHRTVRDLLESNAYQEIINKLLDGSLIIAKWNPKPGTPPYRTLRGPYTPQSCRNYRTLFNAVLNHARKASIISAALLPAIDTLPEKPTAEPPTFTSAEMDLIVSTARHWQLPMWQRKGWHKRMFMYAMLGRYSGVRSEWLHSVRWRHVDFHLNIIRWDQAHASSPNKRAKAQAMPGPLGDFLFSHFAEIQPGPDDLLIYSASRIANAFADMIDHLGLRGASHAMRHGFITELLMNGYSYDDVYRYIDLDIETIQKTYDRVPLGHVTRSLAQIYGEPAPKALPAPKGDVAAS